MREELVRQINPITENFVNNLLELWDRVGDAQNKISDEYKKIEAEKRSLKEKENENNKFTKLKQEKLDGEILKYNELEKQLNNEVTRNINEAKRHTAEADKVAQLRRTLEDEQKLSSAELVKQRKKTQEYQLKTDLLQVDQSKQNTRHNELVERDRKVDAKERTSDKREQNLMQREQKCAERELDSKGKEKRITFEYKKLGIK